MIDLHAHTTASDGSLAPAELVQLAKKVGLSALAVTDHDTAGGLPEAEAAARHAGIDFVPGIEISVDHRPGQFHLLGYFIDFRDPEFLGRLKFLQDSRSNRNVLMVEKMQAAGLPVTLEEIEQESGGGQVGRPHMAALLVRKGIVSTVQEAFDQYLADGKPCHLPKAKLEPPDAIDLVHQAGGVAVLAHPKFLRVPDEAALAVELEWARDAGLDGIEAYYSQHTPEETERYLRLAERFGFLVTAGSDFHGTPKPHVHLGRIYHNAPGSEELLDALRSARNRIRRKGAEDAEVMRRSNV